MILVFDIVKSGKNAPKEHNFRFDTNGGVIGRNSEASWTLTDPQNYISGTHARIEYKDDTYFLVDESTNGTFLKFPYKKLPSGYPIPIKASDTFIVGDHEIQARFSQNDYGDDDIVVSNHNSHSAMSGIIPNDDFLFESQNSGFNAVGNDMSKSQDIMNLVDGANNLPPMQSMATTQTRAQAVPEVKPVTPTISQLIPDDAFDEELDLSSSRFDQLDDPVSVPGFKSTTPQMQSAENIIPDTVVTHVRPEPVIEPMEDVETMISEAVIEPMEQTSPQSHVGPTQENLYNGDIVDDSLLILSKKLGIDLESLAPQARNDMMEEIGDAMAALLYGVHHTLGVTKKMQLDMDLSPDVTANTQTNPFGTHSSPAALLQTQNRKDMMGNSISLTDAIKQSFEDINQHAISLHSASKGLLNKIGMQFSPRQLEYSLATSKRFANRNSAMWESYKKEYEMLDMNPHAGETMFAIPLSVEYTNVAKSLNLTKKI